MAWWQVTFILSVCQFQHFTMEDLLESHHGGSSWITYEHHNKPLPKIKKKIKHKNRKGIQKEFRRDNSSIPRKLAPVKKKNLDSTFTSWYFYLIYTFCWTRKLVLAFTEKKTLWFIFFVSILPKDWLCMHGCSFHLLCGGTKYVF